MLSRRLIVVLLVSLSVLLSACTGESPEAGAKEWFNAVMETRGKNMLVRTCQARLQEVQTLGQSVTFAKLGIGAILQMFGLSVPMEIDASELVFTTVQSDGNRAEVKVEGTVYVSMLGVAQGMPVSDTWIMVKEADKWKWCGSLEAQ